MEHSAMSREEACQRIKDNDEGLKSIDLSHLKMKDQDLIAVTFALKHNTFLTELVARDSSITSTGIAKLTATLESNYTMERLYLQGNPIGDDGAEFLAKYVEGNDVIVALNLSGCEIGDVGAAALCEALMSKQCSLKRLYLYNNKIGNMGAEAIREIIQVNRTLQELYLWDNPIGQAELDELKKAYDETMRERKQGVRLQLEADWVVKAKKKPALPAASSSKRISHKKCLADAMSSKKSASSEEAEDIRKMDIFPQDAAPQKNMAERWNKRDEVDKPPKKEVKPEFAALIDKAKNRGTPTTKVSNPEFEVLMSKAQKAEKVGSVQKSALKHHSMAAQFETQPKTPAGNAAVKKEHKIASGDFAALMKKAQLTERKAATKQVRVSKTSSVSSGLKGSETYAVSPVTSVLKSEVLSPLGMTVGLDLSEKGNLMSSAKSMPKTETKNPAFRQLLEKTRSFKTLEEKSKKKYTPNSAQSSAASLQKPSGERFIKPCDPSQKQQASSVIQQLRSKTATFEKSKDNEPLKPEDPAQPKLASSAFQQLRAKAVALEKPKDRGPLGPDNPGRQKQVSSAFQQLRSKAAVLEKPKDNAPLKSKDPAQPKQALSVFQQLRSKAAAFEKPKNDNILELNDPGQQKQESTAFQQLRAKAAGLEHSDPREFTERGDLACEAPSKLQIEVRLSFDLPNDRTGSDSPTRSNSFEALCRKAQGTTKSEETPNKSSFVVSNTSEAMAGALSDTTSFKNPSFEALMQKAKGLECRASATKKESAQVENTVMSSPTCNSEPEEAEEIESFDFRSLMSKAKRLDVIDTDSRGKRTGPGK